MRPRGAVPVASMTRLLGAAAALAGVVSALVVRVADHYVAPGEAPAAMSGIAPGGTPAVRGGNDFVDWRDATYLPGRDLLHGFDPYDITGYLARHPGSQEFDLYGPHHLLLTGWAGALPYPASVVAGFALIVLGSLLLAAVLLRAAGAVPHPAGVLLVGAALLAVLPGRTSLVQGQLTPWYVLGAAVAWREARQRPWVAACGLAVVAVKPQLGVPLAIVLVLAGAWTVVARAAVVVVVLSAVPLTALLVIEGPGRLLRVWVDNASYSASVAITEGGQRVDLAGALLHEFSFAPGWLPLACGLFGLAALVALLVRARSGGRDALADPAVPAGVAAGLLLLTVEQEYGLLLLAWPLAVLVGALPAARRRTLFALAGAVSLALLLPQRLLLAIPFVNRIHPLTPATAALIGALAVALLGSRPPAAVEPGEEPSSSTPLQVDRRHFDETGGDTAAGLSREA